MLSNMFHILKYISYIFLFCEMCKIWKSQSRTLKFSSVNFKWTLKLWNLSVNFKWTEPPWAWIMQRWLIILQVGLLGCVFQNQLFWNHDSCVIKDGKQWSPSAAIHFSALHQSSYPGPHLPEQIASAEVPDLLPVLKRWVSIWLSSAWLNLWSTLPFLAHIHTYHAPSSQCTHACMHA